MVTHRNNEPVASVEIVWIAPRTVQGNLEFV